MAIGTKSNTRHGLGLCYCSQLISRSFKRYLLDVCNPICVGHGYSYIHLAIRIQETPALIYRGGMSFGLLQLYHESDGRFATIGLLGQWECRGIDRTE